MIDLNNAPLQDSRESDFDVESFRARLIASTESFVAWIFPGRVLISRSEARIGNIRGEAGTSLSIALQGPHAGQWIDHSTNESGDLIGLYRAYMGYPGTVDFILSLKEICRDFFHDPIELERPPWRMPSARIEADKIKLGTKPRDSEGLGAPVAEYRYFDAGGNIVAKVARYEPDGTRASKTFRPYSLRIGNDGRPKWMAGSPDPPRPLYRLPQIIKAPGAIVLVEGEGCADALVRTGIEATSAMHGANAPLDKTDWQILAGKPVIVWPDNDLPGLNYGKKVAEKLLELGAKVWMVQIPAAKGMGWDAGDCVADGEDPNVLLGAAVEVAAQPASSLIQARPFVLRDPTAIPKRQWLYGHHLIRTFGSATIALGGVGKSSQMIVEALAMATGRALLGVAPKHRLRVWLWNGEDPLDELERRIGAACIHYGIDRDELNGWLFVNSGRELDSRIVIATETRDGAVISVPVVEALIETIRFNQIDVVQIDPFISSHKVTENDNNAIDVVAKEWTRIADVTSTAIDLSHHSRKTGGHEVTVEDGRGAIALLNAVRSARVLNTMTEDEASRAGVVNGRRSYFKLANGKLNLAIPPDHADWFHMISVRLGNGVAGDLLDRGDEVGVVTAWQWPDPLAGVTGADFDKAALAIRSGHWRKDVQCNDWVGVAVARALGLKLSDKADKAKVKAMIASWLVAGSLIEVEEQDKHRKTRIYVEVANED
jgi:AAA domain